MATPVRNEFAIAATKKKKTIPSLKWPALWIAGSGVVMVQCILDFTVDREEDAAEALQMFPITVIVFAAMIVFYRKRLLDRQQWRRDKLTTWIMSDLPPIEPAPRPFAQPQMDEMMK